jgi:hypothetical protein
MRFLLTKCKLILSFAGIVVFNTAKAQQITDSLSVKNNFVADFSSSARPAMQTVYAKPTKFKISFPKAKSQNRSGYYSNYGLADAF